MSENVIQNSFSSGELAPSIYARTDIAAYRQGLAVCRNFFVDYRSGVSTRNGTEFVIQCFKSSTAIRPIGFSVSTSVTYVIEFGDRYCRFINNGAAVLEAPFSISSISSSAPAIVLAPGNNFNIGDWVFITGVVGMTAINNRYCQVISNSGGNVGLSDVNGNAIDSTIFGAYASGGTISRVYTIASPYAAADLSLLKFVQSVSQLYITHPNYPPQILSFISPTNWTFTPNTFGTTITAPTGGTGTFTAGGAAPTGAVTTWYGYVVTTVDKNGQESLPSAPIFFSGAFNIAVAAGSVTLSWSAVAGAAFYNVYKTASSYNTNTIPTNAMYGFVGFSNSTSFVDSNISPDFASTPPATNNNPFASGNNPSCVTFFQQRAYFASTAVQLSTFWASQPGSFNNFNQRNPIQADDFLQGTIVSTQLNQIKHMLPMPGGLIMLTGRAAFTLSTGQGANATLAVTPLNATITPQAYTGASDITPIIVNEDILYVQAKASIVRDLSYNIYAAIYTGTDISVKSNHLFFQHTILYWAFAEEPFKVVWAVRDDGILLSLTFLKEQQIAGWARHDTQGLFTSVATVQEGTVDATYFVVQRRLPNGTFVQWIERQMERTFTYGAEDAWGVDAGEGNRSSLPTPNATLTISNSTGTVNITASTSVFNSASVGQVLRAGGGIISITGFTSATQITGTVTKAITQTIPNTSFPVPFAPGAWSIATPSNQFFGFDYLIGQRVNVVADGSVFKNLLVAADGSISLPNNILATKVVGGLGFQAQAQTMPLDVGEPTAQGKRKKIAAMNMKFADSRGLKVGRTFNTVVPMKDLNNTVPFGQPIPLISGEGRVIPDALWDVPGQVCFQVDDPMPVTILGIIPEIVIGDTVK
jgi:hypothetical protein